MERTENPGTTAVHSKILLLTGALLRNLSLLTHSAAEANYSNPVSQSV